MSVHINTRVAEIASRYIRVDYKLEGVLFLLVG